MSEGREPALSAPGAYVRYTFADSVLLLTEFDSPAVRSKFSCKNIPKFFYRAARARPHQPPASAAALAPAPFPTPSRLATAAPASIHEENWRSIIAIDVSSGALRWCSCIE